MRTSDVGDTEGGLRHGPWFQGIYSLFRETRQAQETFNRRKYCKLFKYSFIQEILNKYYVPSTVLGAAGYISEHDRQKSSFS